MKAGREKFGAFIRREREAKEIGLREMAKKIGVSPTYLSKVERAVVEYVGLRWLQHQHSEVLRQHLSLASSRIRRSIGRRAARIRGRHASAVRMLTKTRSLLRPPFEAGH